MLPKVGRWLRWVISRNEKIGTWQTKEAKPLGLCFLPNTQGPKPRLQAMGLRMTSALTGTRHKWKAFWGWQDANGNPNRITQGQGSTDKIHPGEGLFESSLQISEGLKSKWNYICFSWSLQRVGPVFTRRGFRVSGLLFGAIFQQSEMAIRKLHWLVRYWVSYH